MVSATDGVTEIIAKGTGAQTDTFFGAFAGALKKDTDIGGGPIMLIVVSLVSVLAAGVLWLELVIRAALLYVARCSARSSTRAWSTRTCGDMSGAGRAS